MTTPKICRAKYCINVLTPNEIKKGDDLCDDCRPIVQAAERLERQSQAIKRAGDRVGGGV